MVSLRRFSAWLSALLERRTAPAPSLPLPPPPAARVGGGGALPPVVRVEVPTTGEVIFPTPADPDLVATEEVGADTWETPTPTVPYQAPVRPEREGDPLPVSVTGYGRRHSHSGNTWAVDVALPEGWRIRAPGRAKVTRISSADTDRYNGNGVWLSLRDGPLAGAVIASIHLSSRVVDLGAEVEAGDVIGCLGWTGAVSPPGQQGRHLHWEIAPPPGYGGLVDPMDPALWGWREAGWSWGGWAP